MKRMLRVRRNHKIKKNGSLILVIILAIFLAACGNKSSSTEEARKVGNNQKRANTDGEKYVLKLSHGFPSTTDMHRFMEWYNEELKKRSDGRLSLEIYPEGQILKHDQEVAGMLQ